MSDKSIFNQDEDIEQALRCLQANLDDSVDFLELIVEDVRLDSVVVCFDDAPQFESAGQRRDRFKFLVNLGARAMWETKVVYVSYVNMADIFILTNDVAKTIATLNGIADEVNAEIDERQRLVNGMKKKAREDFRNSIGAKMREMDMDSPGFDKQIAAIIAEIKDHDEAGADQQVLDRVLKLEQDAKQTKPEDTRQ